MGLKELGVIIKEKREKRGLSIEKLSKELKVDQNILVSIEEGYIVPKSEVFLRMARLIKLGKREWDNFCLKWINEFLSKEELLFVIVATDSEKVREKAWEKLLKYNKLTYEDFTYLLDKLRRHEGDTSEKWQRIVSEEVLRRGFNNSQKIAILSLVSSEKLLRKIGHNWNLDRIIMLEAQRKLLSRKGLRREAGTELGWKIL